MTALTDCYRIEKYIDTFALGHYARVMDATDLRTNRHVAFKVMRPEHLLDDGDIKWEFRAFANEAEILYKLQDSAHIINLYDVGYVSTREEAPSVGEIASYGTDIATFTSVMTEYGRRGWRPYMALENLPRVENLFYLMKPAQPGTRRRLPSEEGLTLALQFGNVLAMAHSKNIVYLDHKLEHVYWDGKTLRIIDFNSSRQLMGQPNEAQEYTKDVHNMCVGILYPLFTGMSPQKTSLRPQPGNMDVVESRYANISQLDFMMEPTLSQALQTLLQRGAAQQIRDTADFMQQMQAVAALHGRDFPDFQASEPSRQARERMRDGLRKLREGEDKIREARDLFREAAIMDGITEDLEGELRRLVKSVNEALNNRVVP